MLTDQQREERDVAAIEQELMIIDKAYLEAHDELMTAQADFSSKEEAYVVARAGKEKAQLTCKFLRDRRKALNGVLKSARI